MRGSVGVCEKGTEAVNKGESGVVDRVVNDGRDLSLAPEIAAAQSGDPEALGRLVARFMPLLRASAFRYRGMRAEAEDLVQCGAERLIVAIRAYRPERGVYFAHYAKTAVRSAILTYVRKAERLRSMTAPLSTGDPAGMENGLPRVPELPDRAAGEPFALAEWGDALAGLSPRERLAVDRTLLQTWTTGELAEVCGVSRETAKTWRRRAIRKLAREWNADP